jgi:hypothetical protein
MLPFPKHPSLLHELLNYVCKRLGQEARGQNTQYSGSKVQNLPRAMGERQWMKDCLPKSFIKLANEVRAINIFDVITALSKDYIYFGKMSLSLSPSPLSLSPLNYNVILKCVTNETVEESL